MTSAPSEDSDQPGHPPSLIGIRCQHEERLGPQLPIVIADALVDLSLRWAHRSFCLFCSAAADMEDSQLGWIPQVGQFHQLGRSYI